jgi:hypothetical protein
MTNMDYSPDKSETIAEPDQCWLANSVEDISLCWALVCGVEGMRPLAVLLQMSFLYNQIVSLRSSSLTGAGELAAALWPLWQA